MSSAPIAPPSPLLLFRLKILELVVGRYFGEIFAEIANMSSTSGLLVLGSCCGKENTGHDGWLETQVIFHRLEREINSVN